MMEYYVYLTNDCNLKCRYCSVLFECKEGGIPVTPAYSDEELAAFVEKTQRDHSDPHVRIFFFGGEPTLEYPRIKTMIAALRQRLSRYELRFALHTNGLLLDRIPEGVLSALSMIILSFNYEKIPSHHLKDSYFSTLMEAATAIRQKSAVPLMARLTITEKTSLYSAVLLTHNFFDLVYWQLENTPALEDYQAFARSYAFELELTFRYWLENLQNGRLLRFVPFIAALRQLLLPGRDDDLFCCGYGSHQIYVQTDGSCYACCDSVPEGTHHIGGIQGGVTFSHRSLSAFICRDCAYRPLCLGRCGRMHREFSEERIREYCALNRRMFDLFLQHRETLAAALQQHPEYREQLNSWLVDVTELTP